MNNFLEDCNLPFLDNLNIGDNIDLNKLLIIILLLTGQLTIAAITVYPSDFAVTLGTFKLR